MASIRKQILSKLETELSLIKAVNGYNLTVRNVYNGIKSLDSEVDRPSIAFVFGGDDVETELESGQIRTVDLILIGYVEAGLDNENTGKLSDVVENYFEDLYKFIYKDSSINSDYTSTLNEIEGIIEIRVINKNPYLSGFGTNKTTSAMILKIFYLEDNISELQNSGTFSNTSN